MIYLNVYEYIIWKKNLIIGCNFVNYYYGNYCKNSFRCRKILIYKYFVNKLILNYYLRFCGVESIKYKMCIFILVNIFFYMNLRVKNILFFYEFYKG